MVEAQRFFSLPKKGRAKGALMKRETRRVLRDWAYYSSLGLQVSLSIVIGLGAGVFLDRKFDTAPWLTLILLFMGIIAGFRNIGLAIRKSRKL
jgi:ATP synthase protein I